VRNGIAESAEDLTNAELKETIGYCPLL